MKEIAQCAAVGGCDRNPLNQAATVPASHSAAQDPGKPRKVGGVPGPSRGRHCCHGATDGNKSTVQYSTVQYSTVQYNVMTG